MSSPILETLERWLANGGNRIGQIVIEDFSLSHHEDHGKNGLEVVEGAEQARQLALYDDDGQYRPLKTAPNLRHGWKLLVGSTEELRLALDYFYPAMLGTWVALLNGDLAPVHLRQTLERQSGMYAVASKITDPAADTLVHSTCGPGCLRTILWGLNADRPITSMDAERFDPSATANNTIPLLCAEACNLLVAAARVTVKKNA